MDDPGMFRVSRKSTDTLTRGGRKAGIHGYGYTDGGVGSQASMNTDTLTGGEGSQASMDDPGMFRVSRESTDTLTGG